MYNYRITKIHLTLRKNQLKHKIKYTSILENYFSCKWEKKKNDYIKAAHKVIFSPLALTILILPSFYDGPLLYIHSFPLPLIYCSGISHLFLNQCNFHSLFIHAEVGRIGIGICYDLRFQELAMIYAARGLFVPPFDM